MRKYALFLFKNCKNRSSLEAPILDPLVSSGWDFAFTPRPQWPQAAGVSAPDPWPTSYSHWEILAIRYCVIYSMILSC